MLVLVFDGDRISWSEKTKTFVFESSDVKEYDFSKELRLHNPKNGNEITFKHYHTDTDGEDVYGWRYRAISGNKFPCELLAIND